MTPPEHTESVAPPGPPGSAPSSALEDQREFLLRSLEDLEREYAAGDVDAHDYVTLKDDYTARAAAVLRAVGAGRTGSPPIVHRPWRRTALVSLGVAGFALLAGVLVAQTAGRRDTGEVVTGGIRQSVTEKLNEARRRSSAGELVAAIELYDEVLTDDPGNAEALTYKGWMLTLSGQEEVGLTTLLEAATANPSYPDVHAFLAIVFFRSGLIEQASRELDRLDALDPSPVISDLTANLRTQIDAALEGTSTTSVTANNQGL